MVSEAPRVVLVTGGAKGVGRGISEVFLAAGDTVVVCGRSEEPDELPTVDGRTAVYRQADVRDPDQVAGMVAAIAEEHGSLDVVVNNAGGAPHVDAAEASPRFSAAIIDLNLVAPLVVATEANRVMQDQPRGGVVVNICSVSGTRPSPGTAAYGAAKAGLINLTESLAVEWAPKVRVVAITAGLIETEQAELHYGDRAGIERVAATVPMGRMGLPVDIGSACAWLASDAASYVSGANLVVHGGGEWPAFLRGAEAGDA